MTMVSRGSGSKSMVRCEPWLNVIAMRKYLPNTTRTNVPVRHVSMFTFPITELEGTCASDIACAQKVDSHSKICAKTANRCPTTVVQLEKLDVLPVKSSCVSCASLLTSANASRYSRIYTLQQYASITSRKILQKYASINDDIIRRAEICVSRKSKIHGGRNFRSRGLCQSEACCED